MKREIKPGKLNLLDLLGMDSHGFTEEYIQSYVKEGKSKSHRANLEAVFEACQSLDYLCYKSETNGK